MATLCIDVRRESTKLSFACSFDTNGERQSLPTFGLDEKASQLDMLGAHLRRHPAYERAERWIKDLAEYCCEYSKYFFLAEKDIHDRYIDAVKSGQALRVVIQTYKAYFPDSLKVAKETLSAPLEFIHPRYDQSLINELEWLGDILPMSHSIETWIIRHESEYSGLRDPELYMQGFDPTRTKVLLISSDMPGNSEAAKETKRHIGDELRHVRRYFDRHFHSSLSEDKIPPEELRGADDAGLQCRLRQADLISLPNPPKDVVERVIENLEPDIGLIVHYVGIVERNALKVRPSFIDENDDKIIACDLVDLLRGRPVELLYISCHHVDAPVYFLDFLIEVAYRYPKLFNLVSFRWPILGEGASYAAKTIYRQLADTPQDLWKGLAPAISRARQGLYGKYCKDANSGMTHCYCWAAPFLIRQTAGRPPEALEKGRALSTEEKEELERETERAIDGLFEEAQLKYKNLGRARREEQVRSDFQDWQEKARQELEELKRDAKGVMWLDDKRAFHSKLEKMIDQLKSELHNFSQ